MSASSESERMPQRQLGELMTELGLISEEQLATVLEVQQQSKRPLGQIIVELGFASGAAVAHALAMQSGGALKTEYGFALGVPPVDEEAAKARGDLPKLRLAPTAVAPPPRASEAGEDSAEQPEAVEEHAPTPVPAETESAHAEAVEDAPETEEVAANEEVPETEELAQVEEVVDTEEVAETEEVAKTEELTETVEIAKPEEASDSEPEEARDGDGEDEASAETPLAVEADAVELAQLRSEIERLEGALAETQTEAGEQDRLKAEVEKLESALVETQAAHEQQLTALRQDHVHQQGTSVEQERLLADVERLETALAEAQATYEQNLLRLQEEHERTNTEIERLQTVFSETAGEREHELARLREERDGAATELEGLRGALAKAQAAAAEEQERHIGELEQLTAQRDRIQEELGDALERLAVADPVAEERDRLRTEVEQLESARTEAAAAHEEELRRLREQHERAQEKLDDLQTALADAQASTEEHERRLAKEQERHASERDELNSQSARLQEELGTALERLAEVGPSAEERDELGVEVERLQETLAELRESSAAELDGLREQRDTLTSQLEEARELLQQAERVRESQIALEAERDHALAELERLQTIATDAQAEADERARLLADEQDRHHAERETLIAQRTVLEQELGSSIEQLAAASSAADAREAQLKLGSQRLLEALEAVRRLAAELAPDIEKLAEEAPSAEAAPEGDAGSEEPEVAVNEPAEAEVIDYSLFVPGPNGYDLIPQTGVPPEAGQTVELVMPNGEEPVVYEVVRSGRTLPGGDVCVFLAQV